MHINLWSGWDIFIGAIVSTALVYLFTIVAVRLAGRRTLAQISGYDVVVTVAIGSLAASTALPSDPSLADGAAVLMTFLLMQALIGFLRQRLPVFRRWVDFAPLAVVVDGKADLRSGPLTAQLTLSELESRLRQKGIGDLAEARVAVLEPTGGVSVTRDDVTPELFRNVKT
jgi:uncharacterized membrane protein YcaP (DUF421 family)